MTRLIMRKTLDRSAARAFWGGWREDQGELNSDRARRASRRSAAGHGARAKSTAGKADPPRRRGVGEA